MQWLVLRRRIAAAGWWILAGAVGGALGGAPAWLVALHLPRLAHQFGLTLDAAAAVATGARVGAVALAGVAQWLVLRRAVRRAGWWVPICAVAALVGDRVSGTAVGGIAGLAIYSALTGLVLTWLLRQPRRAPGQAPASG